MPAPADPILIALDVPRPIRWTRRAEARNASLARPVEFADVMRGKRRLYALCALIWAALVDKDHGFEAPEDLADHLGTPEQQVQALKALNAMVAEAFPPKEVPPAEPSTPGPAQSSRSGSARRRSTTGS